MRKADSTFPDRLFSVLLGNPLGQLYLHHTPATILPRQKWGLLSLFLVFLL